MSGSTRLMTPAQIAELHGALNRIKSLDETAEWIGNDIENSAEGWGQKVRDIFGQNRLCQWRNRFLGEVLACAAINELMNERAEVAADVRTRVDVPSPPTYVVQTPNRDDR